MAESNELHTRLTTGTPAILLVDDDKNILDTAKDILEEAKYEISVAATGKAALEQLEKKTFNVVVVDFQLPDATGLELARKVREHNLDTCVILMTGHASLEMAVKAIQESIYDYLIKPVDPAQLKRTIEKAIEKQRLTIENHQLINDLKRANDEMGRLDSLKSKMLRILSHDLRTPLSSIRGYSELLKSGVKGKMTDAQKRMIDITIQESDHLNGLIGDLLDLASIDSGRLALETRTVRFEEVIDKALPRVRLVSELKEVGLDVSVESPLPLVNVDFARMVQVIANLMRSCLKQSTRGGKVYLAVSAKGNGVEARITHNGQGLTPEQLKNLFISTKTPGETNSSQDGLRIGLAIAREILHAHGGEIGADSRGEDQGVTFWIRVPAMRQGAASI